MIVVKEGCWRKWKQWGPRKSHPANALLWSPCCSPILSGFLCFGEWARRGWRHSFISRGRQSQRQSHQQALSVTHCKDWGPALPLAMKPSTPFPNPLPLDILQNLRKGTDLPTEHCMWYYRKVAPANSEGGDIKIRIKVGGLWKILYHGLFKIEDLNYNCLYDYNTYDEKNYYIKIKEKDQYPFS